MASLVLQTAGQAVGGLVGGPVGAMLGRAAGGIAGSLIDQTLFGRSPRRIEGPRLSDLHVMASSEGAPIPRLWGRARLTGQVIWATRLEEEVTTRSEGGGKGQASAAADVTEYLYFANFAVALCEGPLARIGRAWADGKEIDLSAFIWRLHQGSEDQAADSLIVSKEGEELAPAYRGTAYIVFERMPLARFGNRLPQLSFEVFRPLDDIEARITAVNVIPGATEFGYDPQIVIRSAGWGETAPENTHADPARSDWSVSIDQLQASCPELKQVSLVAAWYGSDLRCGECLIRPAVERADKTTNPAAWRVAGLARDEAPVVSAAEGRPAFGGTPDDASLVRAIADLNERNIEVAFYPFILMDIPADSALPDPYGGGEQPAYPWRGRITCHPAPGLPDTPDKTAAAAEQVAAFFGSAALADFAIEGGQVVYSGPEDWGLRRMVLHYAHLCAAAGGVHTFLIGSELRGLTALRDGSASYPAVAALVDLAADVAEVLPDAQISYAADWSEYFGHHPPDGSGDVHFHLDPLWASPNVSFIGIDNYMPLSDWRDGGDHLDAAAGSIYDLDYLKGAIAGGEGFEWYYASEADRELQVRTPITDSAYAKPWMFRYKDLVGWWSNEHFDRPGGIENAEPTDWEPQSKQIRFTEAGFPSVDKGTNEPNVFYDPKSAESRLPHFSNGARDDFIQRRGIEALLDHWSAEGPSNPLSDDDVPMVDASRIAFWAWDARPFPAFPARTDVWADGANHERGHWLNGRLGAAPLATLVSAILEGFGFTDFDASELEGVVDGYLIDRPMSARAAIEPLAEAFAFDAVESGGLIRFRHRGGLPVVKLTEDDLVEEDAERPLFTLTRTQETELPASLRLGYVESGADYRRASVEARRLVGASRREASADLPAVLPQSVAQARAEILLQEAWSGREAARFALPPSALAFEPGDTVELSAGGRSRLMRIESVSEAGRRQMRARAAEPFLYEPVAIPPRTGAAPPVPPVFGTPAFVVLDLPLISGAEDPHAPHVAAAAAPWPGRVGVYVDQGGDLALNRIITVPAIVGETLDPLPVGPVGRLDRAARFRVRLVSGSLGSVSEAALLSGANIAAVGDAETGFEVLQFRDADLVAPRTYELSMLLRAQAGSDPEMLAEREAGTRFVLVDRALSQLSLGADTMGRPLTLRIGPASFDPAHPALADASLTFRALALRPLSPVHVRSRRSGEDVTFSWIRRTRQSGDAWEQAEVPLAEESERYEVDILDGATVVRTIAVTAPQALYTAADQEADFGLPLPSAFTVRVHQIAAAFGRGAPREALLNV